jgi:CxxC-x17-CxxC domain-containing protein
MAYGNFRGGSSGSRGGFGGPRRSFGGPRRSFGPREMTKIKCSSCGKDDEVPFKPREGTPVYCKDCYFKQKGITPRAKKEESAESSDEFGEAAPSEEGKSEEEF